MRKLKDLNGHIVPELKKTYPQSGSVMSLGMAFPGTTAACAEFAQQANSISNQNRHPAAEAFTRLNTPRCLRSGITALFALFFLSFGAKAQNVFSTPEPIGSTSGAQTVTVPASATGTVAKVEVITRGVNALEFAKGGGVSSCESAGVTAGGTCTESVTFAPAYPGVRTGAVVLLDLNNNVLGTGYVSGIGQGGLAVLSPGNTITIAGKYRAWTSTQDGVAATVANIDQPASIAFDGAGNMYIADSAHNKVRMVCFSATSATIAGTTCSGANIITTVAGTGDSGYKGDNGPASASTLSSPTGISIDGAGNLFIADTSNNVIREVNSVTGIIATVAGNGTSGYGGDGLVATNASIELDGPTGITVDASGNLYIADTANQRIRRIDAVTGIITTAAGNGNPSGLGDGKGTYFGDTGLATNAGLSLPYAVAFDPSGNMYIPDSANHRIRVVAAVGGAITAASTINTIAGTGAGGNATCPTGPAISQTLNTPSGVAIDAAGNIYIADTQDSCIRKVNSATGIISSIAMNGATALSLAGAVDQAQVYAPIGIAVDGMGNVYYADFYYMIVDEIQSNTAVQDFRATPVRQGSQSTSPLLQGLENDGNAPLDLSAFTAVSNSAVSNSATTCSLSNPFTEDADCSIGALFAPQSAGNPLLGTISVTNTSLDTPLSIVLIGDATAVNSTSITLASAPNPSEFNHPASFTATVSTGANTGSLTGTVTFSDTFNSVTTQLGAPIAVNASGVATLSYSTLAVGVHTVSAVYNGDPTHFASTAPATVQQTIYEATRTVLTAAPSSPSAIGANVTFTAAVSVTDGGAFPLDGSVTFTDNAVAFAGNTIPIVGGVATFTTNALTQGVNTITATYAPNTTNLIQGSTTSISQAAQTPSTIILGSNPNPSIYGNSVAFTVTVPTVGSTAATGSVNISIVPVGSSTAVATLPVTLSGNPGVGSASISTLAVGTYSVTGHYAGDNNYAQGTSAPITQTVNVAQTATALTAAPNPGIAGKAVALTATVTVTQGTATPTGSVQFSDTFNGATTNLGSATVGSNGKAVLSPVLAPGAHAIVATYGGDKNDNGSSGSLALAVIQATTTASLTVTPNPAIVDGIITFSATVSGNGGTPTGTISFLAGATTLGTATLSAGNAQITNATLAAGTYSITAVYQGDANDDASTSAAVSLVIGTIPTATNISTTATSGSSSQTILVSNVVDEGVTGVMPTGTVTFTSGTSTIGAATLNSSGVATLSPDLATGNYTIIATYSGDALHSPSTSVALPITGAGTSFNLVVNPTSVSVQTTQSTTVNVSLSSISGFTDTIGLGCVTVPAAVNCHFSSGDVNLAANGSQTAQLVIDTNNPLGGGTSAMLQKPAKHNMELAGLFAPFSLLMGWMLWSFRKRHAHLLSLVLLLVLSGAAMMATGCSAGFSQSSAAPGTYALQVAGVGKNSNVTQYATITLTITK